jgi:2-oxoglutarate/2-oxoacid ferredoxin oxidoreductase subunit alpha
MKTTPALAAVNDFVVKFANVNGSGSASANELFARAILRMGVPVSPRNIFPSNIQGLPTWYEVRVTEKGYLGRRGGVDMMVAMNPQTWAEDVKELEPGGYLFYDSTKPMPSSMFRDDINIIGVPLTAITNATYSDARQRQLFKNSPNRKGFPLRGSRASHMGVTKSLINRMALRREDGWVRAWTVAA